MFYYYALNLGAQKDNVVLSFPNANVFYKGYSSVFQVGFAKKRINKFKLECLGCDTIYPSNSKDAYTFVLIRSDTSKIVLKVLDTKKRTIAGQFEFKRT